MPDNTLQQAAATVAAAELSALQSLQAALSPVLAAIDAVIADLDYPEGFASDAKRIASNVKMTLTWPVQEIANKLAPPAPVATPVAPVTPQA